MSPRRAFKVHSTTVHTATATVHAVIVGIALFLRLILGGGIGLLLSCTPENEMPQERKRLTQGIEIEQTLKSDEADAFRLTLEAGEFIDIEVEQHGIDIEVELFAPDDSSWILVDSPNGRSGSERLLAVAETAGEYRLEVRPAEAEAPEGAYRLHLRQLSVASPEDRQRATGERLFAHAEGLRRQGKDVSRREALTSYRETLSIWQELGALARQADTHQRLGRIQVDLGELRPARRELDTALAIYREAGDRRGEAITLNHLGRLQWQLGATDEALADVRQGLAIYRELGAEDLVVDALNSLAVLHRRRGETNEALQVLAEAGSLYRQLKNRRKEALTQGTLGTLLLQQGKLAEAADHLEAALSVWQDDGNHLREAFAWSRLGEVRKRQKRFDEALENLHRTLSIYRETGNRRGEATALNGLGTIYLLHHEQQTGNDKPEGQRQLIVGKSDLKAGKDAYGQALALYREVGDPRGEAIVEFNLGRLQLVSGQARESLAHHDRAALFLAELGDRQVEASNQYGRARALHDLREWEAARTVLEPTLDRIEELRVESSSEALRIAFFATRQHYYELLIDILQHLEESDPGQNHAARAFEISERRRARALLDLLGEDATAIRQHADSDLLAREGEVQHQLNVHERHRLALRRSRQRDEEALARIDKAQRQLRLDLDQVRARLRQQSPGLAELLTPEPIGLKDIQRRLLSHRTVLLAYSLGDERSVLWWVSRDTVTSHTLPGRIELEALADEAHKLLADRDPRFAKARDAKLKHLAETLLRPIAPRLEPGQRLLVIADGALLNLPFAVLPKPGGGKPLLAEHEVVHLVSASVILTQRTLIADRIPAPYQLAIYADPLYQPPGEADPGQASEQRRLPDNEDLQRAAEDLGIVHFAPLPQTSEEAEGILEVASGKTLPRFGAEASKRFVLADPLREYQIIHFATHGLLNRVHPELSGLVLSLYDKRGRPQADPFLSLHEIYTLDLRAELVVLSACQTGLGATVRGEGILGLTRGFMYAGVPRVLVSLWNVSDQGTAELMKRFYWSLLEAGAPPAAALRAAQVSMLEDDKWQSPYYWAPFILVGDWRRPGAGADDDPIEEADGGAIEDVEEDIDYPGPDEDWCEDLPEPWMKNLCRILRRAQGMK